MTTTPRTMEELLSRQQRRLTSLERRLRRGIISRVSPNLGDSGRDLNDLTLNGTYVQVKTANAVPELHYPAQRAGFLEVISSGTPGGVGILQRYTDYFFPERVWARTRYGQWNAWALISGEDLDGFVDLRGYLAAGVSYSADGASDLAGIRARRVGPLVELSLGNFTVASLTVNVNGDIPNMNILTGIPQKFRPKAGAALSAGWNGRVWSGFVRPTGNVTMAAVIARTGATGTETWTNTTFSGSATYLAADASI